MKSSFVRKCVAVLVLLVVSTVLTSRVHAQFISNVTAATDAKGNYLNYDTGGMRVKLTKAGCDFGTSFSGAAWIAADAINSWQRQTGKTWPYYWRGATDVAIEIQIHCWYFGYTNMTRPITISFVCGRYF